MAATFQLVLLIGLSSGLLMGADARCRKKGGCKHECMGCPDGWTIKENRCYRFEADKKEWCDAEKHCIAQGGNLASIHDAGELHFIRGMIDRVSEKKTAAWLGGTDAIKEGCWMWSDGSSCDFKYWGKNQPSKKKRQDCMLLGINGVNNIRCNVKAAFVCTRDVEPRE
ncbi:galactose-specific lectin nattectin-like [Cheilinus undulatus]|uniref:galactose-specific lectin nattectin-like n=1 Tax=Cheilinus undulatus TaxID=241271 RepID=UPI001BD69E77|nr:galactose-specific lectin nattectin-like [Cheilinus undulatus]